MADKELLDARVRALCERRFELAVKAQEVYLEVARTDLELVRAGMLPSSDAIAGTIGATLVSSFGGTIGATALAGTIGATAPSAVRLGTFAPPAGTIGATTSK